MFIQVMQGRVADETRLRAQLERWLTELAPGAEGWLGGTFGTTDDGTFVGVVRFASREAAERNSRRAEQDEWWRETASCFAGDVTFHDCPDARVLLKGGSDTAGFVQVIQARVVDRDRLVAIEEQAAELMASARPDVIAATLAIGDDGTVTETVAFVSEDAAREAERREPPQQLRALREQEASAMADVSYLDLHRPWFASAV